MEIINLTKLMVEYLFLSSIILFILGLISLFVMKILKIKGKPRLWISSLLVILPLVYPIKILLPDAITVPIPSETYRSFFQPIKTNTEGSSFLKDISFLATNEYLPEQVAGEGGYNSENDETHTGYQGPPVSESFIDWKLTATLTWVSVFLFFIVRIGAIIYSLNRFLKHTYPVTDFSVLELFRRCVNDTKLDKVPYLRTAEGVSMPMVMGFLKPVIIIPEHLLMHKFREGLRFALLHELKHVHQKHNWWLLVESIIGAVYFFHPVIHWAKRSIHEEFERICDSHVINITNRSVSYADFLLHQIWQQNLVKNPSLSLSFLSGVTKTRNRVHSILENNSGQTLFTQIRGRIAVGMIFLVSLSFLLCSVAPYKPVSKPDIKLLSHTVNMQDNFFNIHDPETEKNAFQNDISSANPLKKESIPKERSKHLRVPEDEVNSEIKKADQITVSEKDTKFTEISETVFQSEKKSGKQKVHNQLRKSPDFSIAAIDKVNLIQNIFHKKEPAEEATISQTDAEKYLFYVKRGDTYYNQGEFEKATVDYSKAVELYPEDVVTYHYRGNANLKQGKYNDALSDYNRAIDLDPGNAYSYYFRANAYFAKKKFKKAISDFSKAIEIDPDYEYAYINRGKVYHVIKKYNRAISDYNKAIELNPENDYLYFNRGIVYLSKRNYNRAISDLNRVIKHYPDDSFAYIIRGNAYLRAMRYERAASDFKKAKKLNPDLDNAKRGLSSISAFYSQRETDKANARQDEEISMAATTAQSLVAGEIVENYIRQQGSSQHNK